MAPLAEPAVVAAAVARAGAAGVVVGGGAAGVCEDSSAAVTGRACCGVLSVPDRGPGDDCTREGLEGRVVVLLMEKLMDNGHDSLRLPLRKQ